MLAAPDHEAFGMGMFHQLPQTMDALDRLPESFRTRPRASTTTPTGRRRRSGSSAASSRGTGPTSCPTCCRRSTAWSSSSGRRAGRRRRVRRGRGGAADGRGLPASRVHRLRHLPPRPGTGRDRAGRGRRCATPSSTTRATTRCRPITRVDLVTTFDCIHDMTHPQAMMAAIRGAVADDGTWLLVDIKALDTFDQNAAQEPDGVADVRHQRAVVHVVGAVGAGRRRPRHARPAAVAGRGDGQRRPASPGSAACPSTTPSTRSTKSDHDRVGGSAQSCRQ